MSSEGTIVGDRYRLDQPIGRGRSGIVWLAFDTRLFRTVAMKRMYLPVGLPPERAEQARAMAMEEGKAAARIEHPCAITVYDVLPDGADVWLVMEYIPSRGMSVFLSEYGTLTPEQAAALGILLGDAMATIHAAGIVHRTLEPGTVLLADDGGVKLTDIGITGGGPHAAYRAPEVTRGGPPSPPADVFSLGATLYTAVEGVPPFGEDGTSPERPPQQAGVLAGALSKMLRSDPTIRPTMADTVRALKAITVGREQTAFVPPTAPAMPTMPVSWPGRSPQAGPTQQIPPSVPTPQALAPQQPAQPQQIGQTQQIARAQQSGPLMQLPVQQVPQAPAPPQPMQVPRQPTARYVPSAAQQAAAAQAVREKAAARRRMILTVAAILCAVLIGIGVSELLFV
ncbi:serine/threonine-protein kinase [Amycolatopsis jiangsuensis]|uniref:non-specific serine/threonine protein kinase n=1 Tax=Amycolatopsis jiangsuensis TaxID=1181879 RepID=A0A840IY92_9PSEU|nr:serine/threonine-protein kinase [Amycolatopsis jiangsuensis]MBB4686365.1 serine/threonine protein kinase [Amycolatopsis jiangsuensis]